MNHEIEKIPFTEEMKKNYTILMPNMAEIQFHILRDALKSEGYNMELLTNTGQAVIDTGLKYVHNDTCYPALLVIGQMISALQSGKYDINKTALIITQTGGGCRASNYIHLLRKALIKAGFGHVPVISLNFSGLEKNSAFKLTLSLARKAFSAVIYGDMLMLLNNQVKPYEINKGESEKLVNSWLDKFALLFTQGKGFSKKEMRVNLKKMAEEFAAIKRSKENKVKVGIVGEIYVKYSALANNDLEKILYEQGCEVMIPGILSFCLYCVYNGIVDHKLYNTSAVKKLGMDFALKFLIGYENLMIDAIKEQGDFRAPTPFMHLIELGEQIIGLGCKMGEGWVLTAEMMELIEHGFDNIVCTQPFGCLPNHIIGKGMIRKIKNIYPKSNIVPIDYDPGATKVNQENRIKLMLAVAKENMNDRLKEESKSSDFAVV